jgi:leader peptidase (prepilin peptidase) / N-methyltransferase
VTAGAAVLFLLPGLALGSFVNVVASRLPRRSSVVSPGSACMACGTPIRARDNIPLVSYAILRGRCRACRAAIGLRYPAVELVTGVLVAACLVRFGATAEGALAIGFCTVLVAVSAIDVEHRIIPNAIVLPATAVALVARTALDPSPEWAVAAFGGALFLFALVLAYPAGMGMGDVKLALLLGAVLGRDVVVALMLGSMAALVPSLVLFARHGRAARKMAIPFGPWLAFGAVVTLFAGDRLFAAYLGLF